MRSSSAQRSAFVWWGVAVGAMLLAHPFAPVVVLVQLGVALVLLRRDRGASGDGDGAARPRDLGVGVLVAAVVIAPWYVWGAFRWIPDIVRGHSYALNPDALPRVRLEPDLYRRIAQWLLGNGGRWTLLSAALVLLALAAPLLASGALRRLALAVLAYVLLFVALLVPLAWALHTYLAVRRIEFLVPPLILLAAIGISAGALRVAGWTARHPRFARVRAGGVVVATMVVVVGLSVVAVLLYYPTQKTEYRALAEVLRDVPRDDTVVVGPIDRRWRRAAAALPRLARRPSPAAVHHRGRRTAAARRAVGARRLGHRVRARRVRARDPPAERRRPDAGDRRRSHRAGRDPALVRVAEPAALAGDARPPTGRGRDDPGAAAGARVELSEVAVRRTVTRVARPASPVPAATGC